MKEQRKNDDQKKCFDGLTVCNRLDQLISPLLTSFGLVVQHDDNTERIKYSSVIELGLGWGVRGPKQVKTKSNYTVCSVFLVPPKSPPYSFRPNRRVLPLLLLLPLVCVLCVCVCSELFF